MRKGENSFKRKDGRREASCIKERDASGRLKYRYCYGKTYTEARAKVEQRKAELQAEKAAVNEEIHNFSYYCEEWTEEIRRSIRWRSIRESTYARYKLILRTHIVPALGEYLPKEVDTEKVRAFTEKLRGSGLAPRTITNILTVLRYVVDYTAKRCPEAPRRVEIKLYKSEKQERRILSYAEQKKLTEYLLRDIDESKFGVLLALYTGMRLGELCALCWYNISLNERTIEIKVTMQRIENTDPTTNGSKKTKILIGPPGNANARRVIPLTDRALALCEKMKPDDEMAYVLTGTRSSYMEPHALQMRFKQYVNDCGLENAHFGMLRNTFAARCVEAGFGMKPLSEIMGYSTANITIEQYIHSSMELKRSNMEKLSTVGM